MSAADRNKIIIGGSVAFIATLLIIFFLVRGRGASRATTGAAGGGAGGAVATSAGAPQPAGATVPGQVAPTAPGGVGGVAGTPGAPAPPSPGAPGMAVAAAQPTSGVYLGAVRMSTGPSEPSRPDPFLIFRSPPPPIPPEISFALPPVVLQANGLRPPGVPETVGPLGRRRVAGLLFNEGAWAILEEDNRTFIIKPGDVVDGSRITAITPDSIFVTDANGNRWEVSLRGLASSGGGRAGTTTSTTIPGMPEQPPAEE